MTIIEFFDKEPLENVAEALMFSPERIVLLGKDYKKTRAFQARLQQVLKEKEIHTELVAASVNTNDYFQVVSKLEDFINTYPDCVFDITGGIDTVLVAMGAVAQKHGVFLRSLTLRSGAVRTILPNGKTKRTHGTFSLTVAQIIHLFGGTFEAETNVPKSDAPEYAAWEKGILAMWDILKVHCGDWNTAMEYFSALLPSEEEKAHTNTVSIPNTKLYPGKNSSARAELLSSRIEALCKKGILQKTETDTEAVLTFSMPHFLEALLKSGTILELYTLLCVKRCKNQKGLPLFSDAKSGVVIDWEFPPDTKERDDVENEIDVFAVKDGIPVFISCKNGSVDSEELYKLHTVANRFGGEYAKKVLVMTYFEPHEAFLARARALNVHIIRKVHEMDTKAFVEALENI